MQNYVDVTLKGLQRNRMAAYYVETKEEVIPLFRELVPAGSSISLGGSVTIQECGLLDEVYTERYELFDRYREGLSEEEVIEVKRQALLADVLVCSSNAITEDGYLYNVDGSSNRIASIAFGPKSVVIVAGINKIVPTLEDAVHRVKTIAAPLNAMRLDCNTYCARTGECASLQSKEGDAPCTGCASPGRICCNYLISGQQLFGDRIKVILVGEKLGY